MKDNFAHMNRLSHSLFGVGELIQDVFIPKTQYEVWARNNANRHSELISLIGRKIEVK